MKKQIVLLTALGLFAHFLLPAQGIRYGLKAGAGMARLVYDNPNETLPALYPHSGLYYSEKGSFKPSIAVGGTLEYDLSKDFFLSSGLTVCSRSYATKADTFQVYDYFSKAKGNLFYLQLPVLLHYRTGRFFLGTGLYGGMGIGGNWKNEANSTNPDAKSESGTIKFGSDPEAKNLRRFDAGLHLELGFGFKQVRLSLAYAHGLTDSLKDYTDPNENTYIATLRQRAITATLSYFWLAK